MIDFASRKTTTENYYQFQVVTHVGEKLTHNCDCGSFLFSIFQNQNNLMVIKIPDLCGKLAYVSSKQKDYVIIGI